MSPNASNGIITIVGLSEIRACQLLQFRIRSIPTCWHPSWSKQIVNLVLPLAESHLLQIQFRG